jgi:hypothetical protein
VDPFTRTIPAEALPEVREKVGKFNARAAKKGLPVVALQVGPAVERSRETESGVLTVWTEHEVTVEAPALTIGDYVLVARVEPLQRNGTIEPFVVTAPGQSLPADYTIADTFACEHCGTARRRSETFIVRNVETDALVQVGRQCIRDFLGHDPAALLSYWRDLDRLADEDEGWGAYASVESGYKADDILRLTARVVAKVGWLSRSKAGEHETPTASHVGYLLEGPHGNAKAVAAWERFNAECEWNERAEAIYNLTIAALDDLKAKGARTGFLGDWEENILRLATADTVTYRRVGYLASAVVLGWKRVNAPRSEKSQAEPFARHEVAEGDKVTVTGTVVYQNVMDGQWGATTLLKVETAEPRRLFVWWASGAWAFEKGETITLKGSVKRVGWDDYAKAEAATLTRCKVLDK